MLNSNDVFVDGWTQGWTPDPSLTVSEWADNHRLLPKKASAEPGRWRTSRTPYLKEIMDCLSPHSPVVRVVFMKGSQVGGTECGQNWIGYIIHHCPGPTLMVQPTVEIAKRISKQRLAPMIEETKVLNERVAEARSRDSGNTLFVKEFKGGVLILTGANSAVGLRSMPIRFLFLDEVDGYPQDVDGEGNPVSLAEKRTSTFARKKIFLVSTPTVKGISKIEREYLLTDQRRYFVPCPHCGHMDWIRWENIQWQENKPETAKLLCVNCSVLIEEKYKTWMLEHGEWRATVQINSKAVGYHISSLYSPLGWKSWVEIVQEFLASKNDPVALKTWINHCLAETWNEEGEEIEAHSLKARLEQYNAEVPHGVGVLIAAVDVQGDRLECHVVGYGAGEESWLIAFSQFPGDPGREQVWFELDKFLLQEFEHESGVKLKIEACGVDSGGHHTDAVYRFCKARQSRKIWALKGDTGKEVVGRPSDKNRYRTKLFIVGTDTAKDILFSRMKIKTPGPGYIHLPNWIDDEYLEQLTSEKAIKKYVKGRGAVREYVKTRERNEALDLTVYSLATLYTFGPHFVKCLGEKAQEFMSKKEVVKQVQDTQPMPNKTHQNKIHSGYKSNSWVNSWR
ncbi:MAG: phage terminase large subunit family protein [Candidatus Jettenia caeni]|nr:MAG: phage terminase large subunit family protein [Candidatus Jettenia caeni]